MGLIVGRTTADERSVDTPYASPIHVSDPTDCHFYHSMDLPGLGVQDGAWDLRGRFEEYIGRVDLAGKRVLDVGTASGFLAFEAERRGAREVVAFDLDHAGRQDLLPFAGSTYVENHQAWARGQTAAFLSWKKAFWLSHRLFKSQVRVAYGDVYAPPAIGSFDVVILGAILEHLVDPLSALRAIGQLADDFLIINTDYVESDQRIARFNGRADLPEASYIFWTYAIPIYHEYMAIMGFESAGVHKDTFAGTRPHPDAPRPALPRVALVYRRITRREVL